MDHYIGLFQSADGPRWRIMHVNGNKLSSSEAYSSIRERDDTVVNLAIKHKFVIRDMDNNLPMTISEGKIVPFVTEVLPEEEEDTE